jgi:hypothetical protein
MPPRSDYSQLGHSIADALDADVGVGDIAEQQLDPVSRLKVALLMRPNRESWAQRRLVLAIWLVVHAGMERLAGRLPFAGIARSR